MAQVNTTQAQFDRNMYQAALAYYGLPTNYKRTFKRVQRTDRVTGQPLYKDNGEPDTTLIGANAPYASTHGEAVWVQVNTPHEQTVTAKGNPKRAYNKEIKRLANVPLDFEYPPNPACAHRIGIALAHYLEQHGLAEPGLPVEDSGGGCHIVLPLSPIELTEETAERWNYAVHIVVKKHIEPEFKRMVEQEQIEMDLSGFDISRVLSAPGTWRPTNPKKADCEQLKQGFLRRWLSPYTDGAYPERKECAKLAQLIRDIYATLLAKEEAGPPLTTDAKASQWLATYTAKHPNSDRSALFQSLVNATYRKFGEAMVWTLKEDINTLSGEKYNGRLDEEIKRSLSTASTPETHQAVSHPPRKFLYASEVQPEPVDYLWIKRLAKGMLTLLVGDPGLGKGLLCATIAAETTTKGGGVVIMSPEDSYEHTIVPRLIAAGADLRKVILLSEAPDFDSEGKQYNRPISFPEDASILEEAMIDCKASLAIIDPVLGMVNGKYDTHRDQESRIALAQVLAVAKRQHCAMLGIFHLNKMQSGNVLYRSAASIAFIAMARIGLFLVPDPDDPEHGRVLVNYKNNLAAKATSLCLTIKQTPEEMAYIQWNGESPYTEQELLNQATPTDNPKSEQESGLFEVLKENGVAMTPAQIHKKLQTGQSLNALEVMLKRKLEQGVLMRPSKGLYTYNGNPLYSAKSETDVSHVSNVSDVSLVSTVSQNDIMSTYITETDVSRENTPESTSQAELAKTYKTYIDSHVSLDVSSPDMHQNGHVKIAEVPKCAHFLCMNGPNRTQRKITGFYCPVHDGYIDADGRPV